MGKLKDKFKNIGYGISGAAKDAAQKAKDLAEKAAKDAKKIAKDAQDKADKLRHDAQEKAKQQAEKVKGKIQNGIDKMKKNLTPREIPFLVLYPFKPVMVQMLNSRKIVHTNSLDDIAKKFVVGVVDESNKKSSVVNVLSGSSLVSNGFKANTLSFNADDSQAEYTEQGSEAAKYEKGAKETKGIIQKIIAWFKERKAKKEAKKAADELAKANGQPLPPNYGDLNTPPLTAEEDEIISKADAISKGIVDNAAKDATDDDHFSPLEILFGVVGLIAGLWVLHSIFAGKK